MTEQHPKTRLQAERLKRQWTQAEVARKIKGEVKTLSRWEQGEQVAGPLKRRKLSALFGETVDISWFRRLETTEEPSPPLWNVPYERNPYFTDEKNRVQHLHTLLTSE